MIGNVIQKKRKTLGLTQSQLAERLGVTAPAVNRWEKNLSFPDATLLAPLARLLQTDLNELFSFYNSLSEYERNQIASHAHDLFFDDKCDEAVAYIDNVIKQNLSDGLLYKDMAHVLLQFHSFKRFSNETIYLDIIAEYLERALELLPNDSLEISESLISVYASMGEQDKAELHWQQMPDKIYNKQLIHAEMLSALKQYELAALEMKAAVLRDIASLSLRLDSLRNTLLLNEEHDLAELASKKGKEFRELFNLWAGFDSFSNLVNAFATLDKHDYASSLIDVYTTPVTHNNISTCPLFENVKLGKESNSIDDDAIADKMADFMQILKKFNE